MSTSAPTSPREFDSVACFVKVRSDDEAASLANGRQYGPVSTVHNRDIDRATAVARQVDTGYKERSAWVPSGRRVEATRMGREGGVVRVRTYLSSGPSPTSAGELRAETPKTTVPLVTGTYAHHQPRFVLPPCRKGVGAEAHNIQGVC